MIATHLETEPTQAEGRPRLLAYHWTHDEDATREDIAWHAANLADCYDLAEPVWFADDAPTLIFHDRPHAASLLAEIRPTDHVLLSLTSAPLVAEWHIAASRLLRLSPHIHGVDSDTNMIDIDHALLHGYEDYIINICRGVDGDDLRKTPVAMNLK